MFGMKSELEMKAREETKQDNSDKRQAIHHLFRDAVLREEYITFHLNEKSFKDLLRTNQEVRKFLKMAHFLAVNTHYTIDLTALLKNEEAAQLFWEELNRTGSLVYRNVRDFQVKPRNLVLMCLGDKVKRELSELGRKPEILHAVYVREDFCAWTGSNGALYKRDEFAGYGYDSYRESSNRFDVLVDIPHESEAIKYAKLINKSGERVRRTYSCYEFSQHCGARAYRTTDPEKKTIKDFGTLPLEVDWKIENN